MTLSQIQLDRRSESSRNDGGASRALTAIMRIFVLAITALSAAYMATDSFLLAQSYTGGEINREYAIKAAYLYNFGHYIQWPTDSFADESSPFVIGILGEDPFGDVLDEIARDKKIGGRRIVIRRFANLADYKPCHILFVASSAGVTNELPAIQKEQDYPVLLVGESPDFAKQGGAINFFIEANRVRFEVNTEVAKREQLKISSKLLRIAKIISSP